MAQNPMKGKVVKGGPGVQGPCRALGAVNGEAFIPARMLWGKLSMFSYFQSPTMPKAETLEANSMKLPGVFREIPVCTIQG